MTDNFKFLTKYPILILLFTFFISCGDPLAKLPGGSRDTPSDGRERAKKNLEQGKGISLKGIGGGKTTYEFSSSNPMWRATFDVIDFMPLVTVDYSGGMIITDWYTDANTTDESLKFTIRFLSNEIRSDSLKIIIHKKSCNTKGENCVVKKISSPKLEQTIRADIIKKAALLVENAKKKKN